MTVPRRCDAGMIDDADLQDCPRDRGGQRGGSLTLRVRDLLMVDSDNISTSGLHPIEATSPLLLQFEVCVPARSSLAPSISVSRGCRLVHVNRVGVSRAAHPNSRSMRVRLSSLAARA